MSDNGHNEHPNYSLADAPRVEPATDAETVSVSDYNGALDRIKTMRVTTILECAAIAREAYDNEVGSNETGQILDQIMALLPSKDKP